MHYHSRYIVVSFLLILIGSTAATAQRLGKPRPAAATKRMEKVAPGEWGGKDARLSINENKATIEFSCAEGEIPVRFETDKKGSFRLAGTYTARSRGPIRIGHEPKPQPVVYSGNIKGRSMTLSIEFPNAHEARLTFTLEKDKVDGRPVRCY